MTRVVCDVESGGQVLFRQDLSGCLSERSGGSGLDDRALSNWMAHGTDALARLRDMQARDALPLLTAPRDGHVVAEVKAAYDRLARGAATIVFFGTGGSSLGGQTVAQFGGWNIPGVTSAAQRTRPATRFYDNLDAETLAGLVADPERLGRWRFVVVSKSGNTPETLSQAIAVLAAVRDAGLSDRIPELFLGITEPAKDGVKNGLRTLFAHHGIPLLDHHTGIGGRFAVLTNVGLLPAVARGLDPQKILDGAQAVVAALGRSENAAGFAPAAGAAVAVGLSKASGIGVQVMMPYADRLARFAQWYVQLWAESLGKGGEGTTPIACVGPVDQHSQLQLFMDGPRVHQITVVRAPNAVGGPAIDPELARLAGFDEMAGRPVGDLVAAQTHAVPEALLSAGRPVRLIDFVGYDEAGLGALLMHFMIETILAGFILDLDPFDQPAVELGKRLTRQRLEETG